MLVIYELRRSRYRPGQNCHIDFFNNLKVVVLILFTLLNYPNNTSKFLELIAVNKEIMKKHAKNLLYDKLHRGGVLVCLGLTLYGTLILGDHAYKYFKYVKPKLAASKAAAERELLSEGSGDKLLLKE